MSHMWPLIVASQLRQPDELGSLLWEGFCGLQSSEGSLSEEIRFHSLNLKDDTWLQEFSGL
jgi:hypothetical protein